MTSKSGQKDLWVGLKDYNYNIKRPLVTAIFGFIFYLFFVIVGSEIQSALNLDWKMGWIQQLTGLLGALLYAYIFKINKSVLGFNLPIKHWILPTIIIGLTIGLIGVSVGYYFSPESLGKNQSLEYYAYEAIAPGIGEEIGLRGLFLGCLFVYGAKKKWKNFGGWWMLIIHAIPFGLLHLLEVEATKLILTFIYTTLAAVLLGHLRVRTASIIPCIIAHNIANLTSGIFDIMY